MKRRLILGPSPGFVINLLRGLEQVSSKVLVLSLYNEETGTYLQSPFQLDITDINCVPSHTTNLRSGRTHLSSRSHWGHRTLEAQKGL